jgi:hypothetical protein
MTLSDNAEPNEPKIAVEATLASADSRHRSIVGDAAFVTPLPVEDPMSIRDHLLNGPLGFGAAPLGNMYRDVPDEEAAATLEAAWQSGTRYFDTAPFYGAGLAEIRLGNELTRHKRDQYVLSTKVGRIILDEVEPGRVNSARKAGCSLLVGPTRSFTTTQLTALAGPSRTASSASVSIAPTSCGSMISRRISMATDGSHNLRLPERARSLRSRSFAMRVLSRAGV